MITLIDIGLGNIRSVTKVLEYLGKEYIVTSNKKDIENASKIIFPGVGSYKRAIEKLHEYEIKEILVKKINENTPYLGICLGMQILSETGYESGKTSGLNIVKGYVDKICKNKEVKLPHVGWNSVRIDNNKIFSDLKEVEDFYFVHSYMFYIQDESVKRGEADYHNGITAYVIKGKTFGFQFHPEKSQSAGLKLIKNFCELC